MSEKAFLAGFNSEMGKEAFDPTLPLMAAGGLVGLITGKTVAVRSYFKRQGKGFKEILRRRLQPGIPSYSPEILRMMKPSALELGLPLAGFGTGMVGGSLAGKAIQGRKKKK